MKLSSDFISLREAADISGYHQDYLSYLIRRGELLGQKVGRNWMTTSTSVSKLIKSRQRNKQISIGVMVGISAVLIAVGAFFLVFTEPEKSAAVEVQTTLSDQTDTATNSATNERW